MSKGLLAYRRRHCMPYCVEVACLGTPGFPPGSLMVLDRDYQPHYGFAHPYVRLTVAEAAEVSHDGTGFVRGRLWLFSDADAIDSGMGVRATALRRITRLWDIADRCLEAGRTL